MYNDDLNYNESAGNNTAGAESRQNQNTMGGSAQSSYQGSSQSQWTGNGSNNTSGSYESYQTSSDRSRENQNTWSNGGWENGGDYYSQKKKPAKERKSSGFLRKAVVAACMGLFFGLFAGVAFYGVQYLTGNVLPGGLLPGRPDKEASGDGIQMGGVLSGMEGAEESQSGIKLTDTDEIRVVSSDVTEVVDEVMPAMVSIVNNFTQTGTTFFGQSYTQEAASSGSGIIVAESETELLIVSNHHVVEDATKLEVTFIDGSVAEASIKGMDSDMDLAVIAIPLEKLTKETKSAIAIATMGDSASLKMGEPVIAIGNALGYGQSVTTGVISALDRQIVVESGSENSFLQTDAAINPGNSGGALLNVKGEVIGINSNKIGGSSIEGMGYAIPISAAKPIISELMLKETRTKVEDGQIGYMGITMQTMTSNYSAMLKIPEGVYIVEIQKDSPAEAAGLCVGDVIVKFEGEKISTHEDLQDMMQYYKAGSTITLTVKRLQNGQYESVDVAVTLGERPASNQ